MVSAYQALTIEKLLELYNALNDSDYTNADQLEIVTLESAIYMSMKNAEQYDTLQEAVERAIEDCIAEGILADF